MVKRFCYMAQCFVYRVELLKEVVKNCEAAIKNIPILTLSLFRNEDTIFLYYECIDKEILPVEILGDISKYLKTWPGTDGERLWVPMYDIFHYNKPLSLDHWRRKNEVKKPIGKIAKLKPEMISSYIFYHYQYQEEKPSDGDKYGIINIHENLLFFYLEEPSFKETALYDGKLNTRNSPNNWGEVMSPHFINWKGTAPDENIWKNTEVLLYIYK
jgi:L-rhamnose mutarotase